MRKHFSKNTIIAIAMFNFIFWFSMAFVSLEIFPVSLFIISAIMLAYEVSSK